MEEIRLTSWGWYFIPLFTRLSYIHPTWCRISSINRRSLNFESFETHLFRISNILQLFDWSGEACGMSLMCVVEGVVNRFCPSLNNATKTKQALLAENRQLTRDNADMKRQACENRIPEVYMEPESGHLENDIPFRNQHFPGSMLSFGGVLESFWGEPNDL